MDRTQDPGPWHRFSQAWTLACGVPALKARPLGPAPDRGCCRLERAATPRITGESQAVSFS
jgi:hypothetical protein